MDPIHTHSTLSPSVKQNLKENPIPNASSQQGKDLATDATPNASNKAKANLLDIDSDTTSDKPRQSSVKRYVDHKRSEKELTFAQSIENAKRRKERYYPELPRIPAQRVIEPGFHEKNTAASIGQPATQTKKGPIPMVERNAHENDLRVENARKQEKRVRDYEEKQR